MIAGLANDCHVHHEIHAKFQIVERRKKRGCRKCKQPRKDTDKFCSQCGSKLSDKAITIPVVVGYKWLNVVRYKGKLYMDDLHPFAGRSYNKCTLSLDYFLSIDIWYKKVY